MVYRHPSIKPSCLIPVLLPVAASAGPERLDPPGAPRNNPRPFSPGLLAGPPACLFLRSCRMHPWRSVLAVCALACPLLGCHSPYASDRLAGAGALLGAGTGAIIGSQTGHAAGGALILLAIALSARQKH